MQLLRSYWWILLIMVLVIAAAIVFIPSDFRQLKHSATEVQAIEWNVPDVIRIPVTPEGDLILYGKDLIAHTSKYLGPKGTIAQISNGMNCQNCHLEAGTRLLGNNFSAVFSTYPKFRARSGSIETIYKRVNDCFERSLNGSPLDSNSREMQAIYAYIKWLGKYVPVNVIPAGAGLANLQLMDRPADSLRGKFIYKQQCLKCHAENGQGLLTARGNTYTYPPLWGAHSYNTGAGLFRISRLAGFVKENMPFDTLKNDPVLTNEEAWDVAAYIVSQPRPKKQYDNDWRDLTAKPFDDPFGPYKDSFSESQHKFGPFKAMKKLAKKFLK